MNQEDEILILIKKYIACSKYMCALIKENFDTNGETLLRARRIGLIPKEGFLREGFYYSFHGCGCYFEFENGAIDVDFGPDDRCDGFDAHRLNEFRESSRLIFAFSTSKSLIEESLEKLVEKKVVRRPQWHPSQHLLYLSVSE